jgi:hypothetical protein
MTPPGLLLQRPKTFEEPAADHVRVLDEPAMALLEIEHDLEPVGEDVTGEDRVNVRGGDGREVRGRHCGSSDVRRSRTGIEQGRRASPTSSPGRIPIRALFSTG